MPAYKRPAVIEVDYKYLTADECESLLKEVKDSDAISYEPWGHYDRNGEGEAKHTCLGFLETGHLENILITQPTLGNRRRAMIVGELQKRHGAQAIKECGSELKDKSLRRLAIGVIIGVLITLLSGCAEHDVGDKVCNHNMGICKGEVMSEGGGTANRTYKVFFKPSGEIPTGATKVGTNLYEISLHDKELHLHENDYYPLHEK